MANVVIDPETGQPIVSRRMRPSRQCSSPARSTRSSPSPRRSRRAWSRRTPSPSGARPPPGGRPPLHRPRPAPATSWSVTRHPHRVVEHRHDQAGPDARQGPARRLPPALRLRRRAPRSTFPTSRPACCSTPNDWSGHVDRLDPDRPGHRSDRHADARGLQRDRQRRRLRRARLVAATVDADGNRHDVAASGAGRVVSAETATKMREMLPSGGVDEGTGTGLRSRLLGRRQDGHGPQAATTTASPATRPAPMWPPSPASCPPRTRSCRSSW